MQTGVKVMQKLIVMSMVLALAGAYAHADNHDGGG